jgi:type I restriction enzyme, S subunit
MNADLPTYPEYRDSGVPWLGEVPEHWVVRRGKWLFGHKTDLNADGRQTNILSLTLRGVVNNDPDNPEGLVPKDYRTYQRFATGDLVFKLIDLENLRTSRVGLVHEDGIMSSAYVRLVARHYGVQRFFFLQYFDLYQRGIFNQLGAGVRSTLGPKDLLDLPILVPDSPEQASIVRFLDHADRRIRRYIAAKTKLISLLNEQKQAIIHRVVTRGLDPNVRLKPSGVEWLGDVPEQWEVSPLRRRWTVTDCKHLTVPFVEDGIPLASVREVKSFELDLSTSRRTTMDWYRTLVEGGRAPERGDVVYCRNVSVGAAAFVNTDTPFAMGQDVCLIRSTGQNQRYLTYFLHGPPMGRQLAMLLVGSTFKRINVADIKSLIIAIPPRTEQDAIAMHLDRELAHLDRPISHARLQIDLMREYRTRLIADVVTGKLDVREAAANLRDAAAMPDDVDEADALAEGEDATEGDPDVMLDEVEA